MNEVLNLLNNLDISYELLEHDAVMTCDEANLLKDKIKGLGGKNLFLKGKNSYYLVIIRDDKRLNIKMLTSLVNDGRLSFGKEVELKEVLGLLPGSVSFFGIINNKNSNLKVIFDKDLKDDLVLCHPNVNTASVSVHYNDLIRIAESFNVNYLEIDLEREMFL